MAALLLETIVVTSQLKNILKTLKKINYQSRISYATKISFKNEDKITFTDK